MIKAIYRVGHIRISPFYYPDKFNEERNYYERKDRFTEMCQAMESFVKAIELDGDFTDDLYPKIYR